MKKRGIKFASTALAAALIVNSLGSVAYANPVEQTEIETAESVEDTSADTSADTNEVSAEEIETPVEEIETPAEETEVPANESETPAEEPEAQNLDGEPEDEKVSISGSEGMFVAVIGDKEYDAYCLEHGKANPKGEANYVKDDGSFVSEDLREKIEKIINEAKKEDYSQAAIEFAKHRNELETDEELETVIRDTYWGVSDEELEEKRSEFMDRYKNEFINVLIWDTMKDAGVGVQDRVANGEFLEYKSHSLDEIPGLSELIRDIMANVNSNEPEKAPEIAVDIVKAETEKTISNTDKIVFEKTDDSRYISQKFKFEIDAVKVENFNLPEGFNLVSDEDGYVHLESDSKPDSAGLALVADYLKTVYKADVYTTTDSLIWGMGDTRYPYQNMVVAVENQENKDFDFVIETDILADLTLQKVDEEGKIIESLTQFYLWYENGDDTYYIVNTTSEDGSNSFMNVKYEPSNTDAVYTLDLTGTATIDGFLLENIVYYLQEAVAPEGYDIDKTVQIICTEEQYETLVEELKLDGADGITNKVTGESTTYTHVGKLDGNADTTVIKVVNKKSESIDDDPSKDPEDKPSTEPEDKPSTDPEDKPSTDPEDKPSADPEDKPSTDPEDKPGTNTPENTTPGGNGGSGSSHSSSSSSRTTSTIAEAPVPEAPLQVLGAFEADEIAEEEIPLAVLPMTGHERTMLVQLLFLAGIAGIVADIVEKIRRKENN